MRIAVFVAILIIAFAPPAAGQAKVPPRPIVGDANSAQAYFRAGVLDLDRSPETAADAFYWANRIEPTWPEALYLRRVAFLRADEYRLIKYFQGDKKARREMEGADSLLFRARMIEPFLAQQQDKPLMIHYFRAAIERDVKSRNPNVSEGELQFAIGGYIRDLMTPESSNHGMAGWLAFSENRFEDALAHYAKAIGKKHQSPAMHDDRATIFYLTQRYDSAASELRHAIDEMKTEEKKEDVVIYRPKALLHYRLAFVFLKANRPDSGRAALTRALEEDLAFYPAHITLGSLALATGDTVAAVQEMGLAVQLGPNDPYPYMRHADLSIAVGEFDAAIASLTKVVALEPLYARPHLLLGRSAEGKKVPAEAVEHYRRFVALAARDDRDGGFARERLQALGRVP